jgi:hypothetical protein
VGQVPRLPAAAIAGPRRRPAALGFGSGGHRHRRRCRRLGDPLARRRPRRPFLPPAGESGVDKSDMQKLRESGVFGPLSFWVTEMRNLQDADSMASGGRVRGGGVGLWVGGRRGWFVRDGAVEDRPLHSAAWGGAAAAQSGRALAWLLRGVWIWWPLPLAQWLARELTGLRRPAACCAPLPPPRPRSSRWATSSAATCGSRGWRCLTRCAPRWRSCLVGAGG